MKTLIIKFAASSMLALALGSAQAGGGGFGGIVYDPTNHMENLVTAARSINMDIKAIKAEYDRMKANLNSYNPLTSIDQLAATTGMQDLAALYKTSQQVGSAIATEAQLVDTVIKQWGASGMSWQAFAKQMSDRAAMGQASAKQTMASAQSAMDSVKTANAARNDILKNMPAIPGVTDMVGASVRMISATNELMEKQLLLAAQAAKDGAAERAARTAKEAAEASNEATLRAGIGQREAQIQAGKVY